MINEDGIRHLTRHLVENGIRSIYPNATNGDISISENGVLRLPVNYFTYET